MLEAQPLTSIQVVDSAVKIGLGAIIGGLFSFLTQKYVQGHLLEKSKKDEYRKKIFEIVDALGRMHSSLVDYIAVGTAVPNHKDMDKYAKKEEEFASQWKDCMSIGFQLDILGLTESARHASIFINSLADADDAIMANIIGDHTPEQSLHQKFDALIASIKRDYQTMF
jgi:hypothetical protein